MTVTALARKTFMGLPHEGKHGLVRPGHAVEMTEQRFDQLAASGLVEHAGPLPTNKMKPPSRPPEFLPMTHPKYGRNAEDT